MLDRLKVLVIFIVYILPFGVAGFFFGYKISDPKFVLLSDGHGVQLSNNDEYQLIDQAIKGNKEKSLELARFYLYRHQRASDEDLNVGIFWLKLAISQGNTDAYILYQTLSAPAYDTDKEKLFKY